MSSILPCQSKVSRDLPLAWPATAQRQSLRSSLQTTSSLHSTRCEFTDPTLHSLTDQMSIDCQRGCQVSVSVWKPVRLWQAYVPNSLRMCWPWRSLPLSEPRGAVCTLPWSQDCHSSKVGIFRWGDLWPIMTLVFQPNPSQGPSPCIHQ